MNIEILKANVEMLEEKLEIGIENAEHRAKSYQARLISHGYEDRSAVAYRKHVPAIAKDLMDLIDKLAAAKKELAAQAPKTIKTYGYDAYKMSKNLTVAQLEGMLEEVRKEHARESKVKGDIFLLDKKGMWKSDQITWAIYYITKKAA